MTLYSARTADVKAGASMKAVSALTISEAKEVRAAPVTVGGFV